ncbi:MAG: helix-turn-helix domain-containing protein [Desulfurellales bacterium]|nr:MAG: helix-turn-helix domain-containing protein [Desulfurellales bacterium]
MQGTSKITPGTRLRSLRKAKGLTQIELAATLNERYGVSIDNNSISSYEHDINNYPPKTYELLVDFFDVSLDYLRCLTDEPKPKPRIVYHPDVQELSERLNSLPNGLRRAVIDVSSMVIDKFSELDSELDQRLADLRARLVAQRGETGAAEWESERGVKLPH